MKGAKGSNGDKGDVGSRGVKGMKGAPGPAGNIPVSTPNFQCMSVWFIVSLFCVCAVCMLSE